MSFKSLLVAVAVAASVADAHESSAFAAPNRQQRSVLPWIAPILATTAGILLSSTVAFAADANLSNGASLFQANCAGCHAGGMNFLSEKKTLQKEALERFQSLDQVKLQAFVQKGMPHRLLPFSNSFSDTDYVDVSSYVLDQALNSKW
jgi:cytochrome c6